MSYDAIAALVSGKWPVWLYEITIGATTYRHTSRPGDFLHDGETWEGSAIRHTKIRQTASIGRAPVQLLFPRSHATALAIRDYFETQPTEVIIRHGYSNDPDSEFVVKFRGRITAVSPGWVTITVTVEPEETAFQRKAISSYMQRFCHHAHYHDPGADFAGCKLALADWETAATVAAVSGDTVTLSATLPAGMGDWNGGIISFAGNRQMVLKVDGTDLLMLGPLPGLEDEVAANGSAAVTIAPGCNLTLECCAGVFDNAANFGGYSWMSDSPYDGRNPY